MQSHLRLWQINLLLSTFVLTSKQQGFWIINDFHVNISYDSVNHPYGDLEFDSPVLLFKETIKFCSKIHPHPNFIILLGDFVSRQPLNQTNGTDILWKTISLTVDIIISYFPNTKIYPVIGNHDQYPAQTISSDSYYADLLKKGKWDLLLVSSEHRNQFINGGYYSVDISSHLRLLVINSILYMSKFKGSNSHQDAQLSWISNELTSAYLQNKTVVIVSHVPIGVGNDFLGNTIRYINPIYDGKLINIFTRKEMNPIQIHLWAHQHTDLFKFNTDLYGMISPSVSPFLNGSNPAIRYFSFNDSRLIDYEQYRLDLASANEGYLNWTKTYQFIDSYKSQLVKNELKLLAYRIQNNSALLILYLSRIFSSIRNVVNRESFVCLLTSLRTFEYEHCLKLREGEVNPLKQEKQSSDLSFDSKSVVMALVLLAVGITVLIFVMLKIYSCQNIVKKKADDGNTYKQLSD